MSECKFRNRIQIGTWTTLRSYETKCNSCEASYTLLFPVTLLSLAEHRVLEVLCPKCKKEFFAVAGELVATETMTPTAEVKYVR